MIHIEQLLNRIQWDPAFGDAHFVIGYYDRVADAVIKVPFSSVIMVKGNHFSVQIFDKEDLLHTVPMHRIREVYRNGELIWHRPSRETT